MTEFNTFTQQVGDALPILEQMGYEVTTFKVTWGLPPKARLRLKSNGSADIQKANAIAAKATSGGVLVSALITSAATAKRIQATMKLGTAFLDVDFAIPPRVNMKFVSSKANEKDEAPRDSDDRAVAAVRPDIGWAGRAGCAFFELGGGGDESSPSAIRQAAFSPAEQLSRHLYPPCAIALSVRAHRAGR
jgi:hypothetical protein